MSLCLGFPASGHGANVALDILDRFSIIVGDYQAGNETEGSAFVYGSYTAGSSSRFGFNGGQVTNDAENVLWLNNGVSNTQTTTLITGSVISRTAVSSSLFTLNGNAAGDPSLTTGEAAWTAALQSELGLNSTDEVIGTLSAASLSWAGLETNSTATLPGNGGLLFSATPTLIDGFQVAVFNVSAADLQNNSISRYDLALNGASTVLINVSGTSVTLGKSFTGDFTNNESKVLFNFYEAETVTSSVNVRSGILAPGAVVNQGSSNIDGSVVAASFIQGAEVHDVRFDGYLPFSVVPEPSGALLALLGSGLLLRRRR